MGNPHTWLRHNLTILANQELQDSQVIQDHNREHQDRSQVIQDHNQELQDSQVIQDHNREHRFHNQVIQDSQVIRDHSREHSIIRVGIILKVVFLKSCLVQNRNLQ